MALWRVHVELEDRPGRLGELATAVGRVCGNILSLHVVGEPTDTGAVTDELLVELPDAADPAGLVASVEQARIPCTLVVRADATELADTATTALALARMVMADPGSAPQAVASLLRARVVVSPGAAGDQVHTLRVGATAVHLGRAWPFTATELSRAAALLEVAAQARLTTRPPGGQAAQTAGTDPIVLLLDGSELRLRRATPADVPLIAAMHARCTPATRSARFLSAGPRLEPHELHRLVGAPYEAESRPAPPPQQSVLAVTLDGGSAVGMANVELTTRTSASFAILVEDAWQGRGLGTALVRRAAELAVDQGSQQLTATTHTQNMAITRLLRRAGLRPTAELVGGMLQVKAELLTPVSQAG